jgi:hypothetical protein
MSSTARSLARLGLPRTAARSVRAPRLHQARFQSTSSAGGNSSHIASGLVGGLLGGGLIYFAYTFTPSGRLSTAVNKTAKEASKKYNEAATKLQQNTPDADQTINYIRDFCYSYVAWIPGGKSYVDTAFKDVDTVREKHRDEVDQILSEAYKQFQDVSKSGLSLETVSKAFEVLADLSKKIGSLAADAASDVLENHPEIKEKVGPSIDQLKQYGDQYGPEAKKQVNDTWNQVRDVLAGGLTAANFEKVRKLVEEKVEQVKKLGDEAWNKGLEQAKPYLDKNPKIKELLEKNADTLKQGNTKELFENVKKAAESGDFGDFEKYVNNFVDHAKSKGSQYGKIFGLDKYFDMIPGGSEILPKLKQMKDVAEKHSEEGEKLLKETLEELKQLLEKKSKKAEDIVNKAKQEAK